MVTMPQDYRWASHRYYVQAKGAPSWLNSQEAIEQIGGRQSFHEFVLSGNEESLKAYYEAQRHSPDTRWRKVHGAGKTARRDSGSGAPAV